MDAHCGAGSACCDAKPTVDQAERRACWGMPEQVAIALSLPKIRPFGRRI